MLAQLEGGTSLPMRASKLVALKVLRPELVDAEGFSLMFADEVRLTMALTHRNIVQTFDAGSENEHHYMVMELVDGCSLHELLGAVTAAGEPFPIDLALFIASEVCAALDYAHTFRVVETGSSEPGIVHRDISPGNILLSGHGDVKLTDFGVAKAAGRLAVTRAKAIKGKLAYMAPEQALGEVGPRSDLFAVGAVLYEMCSGRPIRDNPTIDDIVDVAVGDIRRYRPTLPASLCDLLERCLAKWPEQRPPSADALRSQLADVALEIDSSGGESRDMRHVLRQEMRRLGLYEAVEIGEQPTSDGTPSSRRALADKLLAGALLVPSDHGAPPQGPSPSETTPLISTVTSPEARLDGTGDSAPDTDDDALEQIETADVHTEVREQRTSSPDPVDDDALEETVTAYPHAEPATEIRKGPQPTPGSAADDRSDDPATPHSRAEPPTDVRERPVATLLPDEPPARPPARPALLLLGSVLLLLGATSIASWALWPGSSPRAPAIRRGGRRPQPDGAKAAPTITPLNDGTRSTDTDSASTRPLPDGGVQPDARPAADSTTVRVKAISRHRQRPDSGQRREPTAAPDRSRARQRRARRRSRRSRTRRRRHARAQGHTRHRPSPARGYGWLHINSMPWALVYVDGRLRGETPLQQLKLPAGRHAVRLVNPRFKLKHAFEVNIRRGKHTRRLVRLE